jgi:beta-galactosidase
MTLMNWKVYNLPMDDKYVYDLRSSSRNPGKRGIFYKGVLSLMTTGDTYFDVSNLKKGIIWVNGHNLGRYWNIGPQQRLYCPASWLRLGLNEILVFDLLETEPRIVAGFSTME